MNSETDEDDELDELAERARVAVEKYLEAAYGPRCVDVDPECVCCNRWRLLDALLEYP